MKDLYSALGIDPEASDEDIAASQELKPGLPDYSSILLNERRRAVYDSTYTTLKTIGVLRQKLKLDSGHSWFLEQHSDFTPKLGSAGPSAQLVQGLENNSAPPGHQAPKQPIGGTPQPASRNRILAAAIVAIVSVILIILIATYY